VTGVSEFDKKNWHTRSKENIMRPTITSFSTDDCIVKLHQGKKYRLAIANLALKEILETFTPALKASTANRLGKQLAKDLEIQFFSSVPPQIKRKYKEQRRQAWHKKESLRWDKWQSHFGSEELAIAQGIRIMNSWIKELGEIKEDFYTVSAPRQLYKEYALGHDKACVDFAYEIKDFWLHCHEKNLVKTCRVRLEKRGWLYEYHLIIGETEFVFHGYFQPSVISDEMGLAPAQFRSGKLLNSTEKKEIESMLGITIASEFTSMMGWKVLQKRFF